MTIQLPESSRADAPAADSAKHDSGRRRLVTGAVGGGGVLLTVYARTALGATICRSPSAMISGNTSPRPSDNLPCSGGRSPGFWKQPQKFQYWPAGGAVPPTFNVQVVECMSGLGDLTLSNIATPGTLVTTVLPGANVPPNTGIWAVLFSPNSFVAGQLMRHLISAWLNAGLFSDYPITKQQVQDMWAATANGGTYCPTGITCNGNGMNAQDVIDYISGMYDFNAELTNDLCKVQN